MEYDKFPLLQLLKNTKLNHSLSEELHFCKPIDPGLQSEHFFETLADMFDSCLSVNGLGPKLLVPTFQALEVVTTAVDVLKRYNNPDPTTSPLSNEEICASICNWDSVNSIKKIEVATWCLNTMMTTHSWAVQNFGEYLSSLIGVVLHPGGHASLYDVISNILYKYLATNFAALEKSVDWFSDLGLLDLFPVVVKKPSVCRLFPMGNAHVLGSSITAAAMAMHYLTWIAWKETKRFNSNEGLETSTLNVDVSYFLNYLHMSFRCSLDHYFQRSDFKVDSLSEGAQASAELHHASEKFKFINAFHPTTSEPRPTENIRSRPKKLAGGGETCADIIKEFLHSYERSPPLLSQYSSNTIAQICVNKAMFMNLLRVRQKVQRTIWSWLRKLLTNDAVNAVGGPHERGDPLDAPRSSDDRVVNGHQGSLGEPKTNLDAHIDFELIKEDIAKIRKLIESAYPSLEKTPSETPDDEDATFKDDDKNTALEVSKFLTKIEKCLHQVEKVPGFPKLPERKMMFSEELETFKTLQFQIFPGFQKILRKIEVLLTESSVICLRVLEMWFFCSSWLNDTTSQILLSFTETIFDTVTGESFFGELRRNHFKTIWVPKLKHYYTLSRMSIQNRLTGIKNDLSPNNPNILLPALETLCQSLHPKPHKLADFPEDIKGAPYTLEWLNERILEVAEQCGFRKSAAAGLLTKDRWTSDLPLQGDLEKQGFEVYKNPEFQFATLFGCVFKTTEYLLRNYSPDKGTSKGNQLEEFDIFPILRKYFVLPLFQHCTIVGGKNPNPWQELVTNVFRGTRFVIQPANWVVVVTQMVRFFRREASALLETAVARSIQGPKENNPEGVRENGRIRATSLFLMVMRHSNGVPLPFPTNLHVLEASGNWFRFYNNSEENCYWWTHAGLKEMQDCGRGLMMKIEGKGVSGTRSEGILNFEEAFRQLLQKLSETLDLTYDARKCDRTSHATDDAFTLERNLRCWKESAVFYFLCVP